MNPVAYTENSETSCTNCHHRRADHAEGTGDCTADCACHGFLSTDGAEEQQLIERLTAMAEEHT